jgi:amidohydrolase
LKSLTREELKEQVRDEIHRRSGEIMDLAQDIFLHPELGYKEKRTAAIAAGELDALGLPVQTGLARTGVKARASGRREGPTVAVLGELDALLCPLHPHADPETGAAHACGHHGQIAAMLGAAMGLVGSGAMEFLDGDVVFLACPAEEYVELDYRQRLRDAGEIAFFGGKQELLRIGAFDDVDMAMMVHAECGRTDPVAMVGGDMNGFVGKSIRFIGREAHAGGAPEQGINALNAAALALLAINSQRETFRDQDAVRVHPILTKGGDSVNIVPADVRMETYVRGRTIQAIWDASAKVDRAIQGSAWSVGAKVEIRQIPGYLPYRHDQALTRVYAENARALLGEEHVETAPLFTGSGDIGDISAVMPAIIPSMGGWKGTAHHPSLEVADPYAAYIRPAQLMAMTVVDLLWDGASRAREVLDHFTPLLDKEGCLAFWQRLEDEKEENAQWN